MDDNNRCGSFYIIYGLLKKRQLKQGIYCILKENNLFILRWQIIIFTGYYRKTIINKILFCFHEIIAVSQIFHVHIFGFSERGSTQ